MPSIEIPSLTIPAGINLGAFDLPRLSIPSITIPSLTIPAGIDLGAFDLPRLSIPPIEIPSLIIPAGITLGSFDLPRLSIPSITIPPLTIPAGTTVGAFHLPPITIPQLTIGNISTGVFMTPKISTGELSISLPSLSVEFILSIPNNLELAQTGTPGNIPQIGGGVKNAENPTGGPPAYLQLGPLTISGIGLDLPSFPVGGFSLPTLTIPPIAIPSVEIPGFALLEITSCW
ncbi:hypothetical protein BV508_29795, partial [Mycobacterium intermedium]